MDIDRLLTCRKAIDEHDEARKDFRAGTNDHMISVETYMKVLTDNGFKGVPEFLDFNYKMNVAVVKEYRPIQGFCDGCVGYKDPITGDPTPPCDLLFPGLSPSASSCALKQGSEGPWDDLYRFLLLDIQSGRVKVHPHYKNIFLSNCPYPHGFYTDEDKCKPTPFNFLWRARLGKEALRELSDLIKV